MPARKPFERIASLFAQPNRSIKRTTLADVLASLKGDSRT